MFGVPGHPWHAPVFAMTMLGAAGVIETVGGTLMWLGLFTRRWRSCCPGRWRSLFHEHYPRFLAIMNAASSRAVCLFVVVLLRRSRADQCRPPARPA